jgi:hypothetical protein
VRRFPQKIGRSGIVFGYDARAEHLGFGPGDDVERFGRFDVAPQISYPLTTTFLQVTPSATVHYTHYTTSYDGAEDATTVLGGPPIDRPVFESSLDVRGPTFSRVFDVGGGYTDRIKHTIGPEINWTYRTGWTTSTPSPSTTGPTTSWARTRSTTGSCSASWPSARVPRARPFPRVPVHPRGPDLLRADRGRPERLRPNYSSSAFGPGYTPAHLSPIISRIRFRPVPAITGDFNVLYDVNFKQLSSMFFTATLNRPPGQPGDRLLEGAAPRRGPGRPHHHLQHLPRRRDPADRPSRLTLDGGANYDFGRKELLQSRARIRFEAQCCGFMAEMIQYNYNQRDERQFRFSIELAHVGSIGNFMGEDMPGQRQGLGSYR